MRGGARVHPKSPTDLDGFEWGLSRLLVEARMLTEAQLKRVLLLGAGRVKPCKRGSFASLRPFG